MVSESDGAEAVLLARRSVAGLWDAARTGRRGARLGPVFEERRGVFATWKSFPEGGLRGCIGYPLPVRPLGQAIEEVAVAAAIDDPRFPPVSVQELDRLCVEVSILTVPIPVPPADRPRSVRAGRDGVIVARGRSNGLLLPQVAVEEGWTDEQLLDATCGKAGLPAGAWRAPDVRVETFQAEVFGEESPGGPVARVARSVPVPRPG